MAVIVSDPKSVRLLTAVACLHIADTRQDAGSIAQVAQFTVCNSLARQRSCDKEETAGMSGWASNDRRERSPLLGRSDSSFGKGRPPSQSRYSRERLLRLNCFTLIHRIKRDIQSLCDTPLSTRVGVVLTKPQERKELMFNTGI